MQEQGLSDSCYKRERGVARAQRVYMLLGGGVILINAGARIAECARVVTQKKNS